MFYDVVIKSKSSFLDKLYTYEYLDNIEIGSRVVVPFGNGDKPVLGIVVSENYGEINYKTKKIISIIDEIPIINKELLTIALYMVKENISDYSSAISTILPPGSLETINTYYLYDGYENEELLEFIKIPKNYEQIKEKFNITKNDLKNLVNSGKINYFFDYGKKSSEKYQDIIELIDFDYFKKIKKNSKKQIKILGILEKEKIIEKSNLLTKVSFTNANLKPLIQKNIIKVKKERVFRKILNDEFLKYDKHILNEEQKFVYEKVINSSKNKFLLKGVTGSGKTEVYLQLVEKYISEGKEAIILVPEISLTPQTIDRFQGRFGNKIAVLHSKLSISQRSDQWKMIKNSNVKIVVGARSAIFAPFKDLGIIIIDEEHEDSYKSEKNPKYSAIDIAFFRSNYQNCKVLLGSATPSIETFYKVYNNQIELLEIKNRATNSFLPQVHIVDMREELKNNNFSMFSQLLLEKIENAIENKNQIILFLNKRGHSSFVFCRSCGYVHKCSACDIAMTYHKNKDRLICHYCGRTSIKQNSCINCGSKWIKEFGAGTELLEEKTKELFPKARVFRMDADTVYSKNHYDEVYSNMKSGNIDILIGTQMIAKGLDFPNVTVVGIMAADLSLNIPSYRSGEKTYSLLTQVSGRAGRGIESGDVIIQTYMPNHYSIQASAKNDFKYYLDMEILKRKMYSYPPFVKILYINISCLDRDYAINKARDILSIITSFIREREIELKEITGPTPSIIERINNRYRFDVIIKSDDKNSLIMISERLRKEKKDTKVYINYRLEE